MKVKSLIREEVVPFMAQVIGLMFLALISDEVLHFFDMIWVGRYLGIPGTIMIILSFLYSLRKRKMMKFGSPKGLLWLHEMFTWAGSLLVLVHAGLHFNAVLPWLAMVFMIINVLSGMVGQRLLFKSRQHLKEMEERYRDHGLSKAEVEREVFWDSVTYDLMAKWRVVHFPISFIFLILSLGHIFTIFLFWGWS